MKSVGIQLRFFVIYRMSIGIQKSTDFDEFYYGMNFTRLFSWKYKYCTPQTNARKMVEILNWEKVKNLKSLLLSQNQFLVHLFWFLRDSWLFPFHRITSLVHFLLNSLVLRIWFPLILAWFPLTLAPTISVVLFHLLTKHT